MKKYYAIFCLIFLFSSALAQRAVFIRPVSDLATRPAILFDGRQQKIYVHATGQGLICGRVAQALFNEVVIILEESNGAVLVRVPNFFYVSNGETFNTFWTQRGNIKKISQLTSRERKALVPPIDFNNPKSVAQKNIVTLCLPWHDPVTKKTYSAGTRFVGDRSRDTQSSFGIKLIDFKNKKVVSSRIAKKYCCLLYGSKKDRRNEFVRILRAQLSTKKRRVPYVWGGMSFVEPYKGQISSRPCFYSGKKYLCWSTDVKQSINGFDCSGLVLRCAQMAGIPYFYRNTTTLAERLFQLQRGEKLEPGDLIWIPGHVMVVADVKNNTLVESTGYEAAYNNVREVALDKRFSGVKTYADLLKLYYGQKCLHIKDRDGNVRPKAQHVKIFKLC